MIAKRMELRKFASEGPRARLARLWPALALFVGYVVTAKIGLDVPVADGLVTPVWAPTGIALAALTLGGLRLWPVVLAAAIVGNISGGAEVTLALGVSVGNTLEAVVGAWLLRRFDFDAALARTRDVAVLIVGGLLSCLVSATNGTTLLWLKGYVPAGHYPSRWMLWWFGDVMGVVVVAALLFAIAGQLRTRRRPTRLQVAEFVGMNTLLVAGSLLVFHGDSWRFPKLLFPIWVLLALRFRALGSTLATFILAAISIGYTISGTVAIPGYSPLHTVQLLQTMLAIIGTSMLVISATLSERDVSQVRLRSALVDEREVASQLRTLDEMKDSLLTAVSHELRTPLTSIIALATLMEDRQKALDDEKGQEMCEHLTREARRLDSLLADLLDLERLRRGLLDPTYELIDLAQIMRTTLERYEVADRPTRVELDDVQIRADAGKVERIFDNLIGNAYKHTPREGCVSVSVRAVDGGALIAIDDEGGGVPDELKRAIFEPFNRGDAARGHVPGTGIGLSLVSHFTEMHGGRAWVEDSTGGGSSFQVFLPSSNGH
jgi:signal transduction histidine kinase